MSAIRIAKDLTLPLEAVTQTIAILAKRRAGKSYTMRRLVEQLVHAEQQVVLVDPKGDQHGIRSSADGKGPGLPLVILGGERADVPLEANAGEVVAKLVVEERVSAVLDLSLFRKHEVATFMTGFLESLYRLKAQERFRTPMMLVIDEADAIAPQKPQKGEERMLGAAEDIVRRGGQRGIGCVLVSQRSAVLNKNVLTQAQVLIALRTIAPQDLAAMNAWIDVHGTIEQKKTLMESLPALPVGDAWVWSPGWPTVDGIFRRVHVLPIETFDSGASPKPGERPKEPKTVADVDLEALKRQMSATIEKAKADDPRELRRLLAEKDRELKRLQAVTSVPGPSIQSQKREVVEKPVITDKQLAEIDRLITRAEAAIEKAAGIVAEPVGKLKSTVAELVAAVKTVRQPSLPMAATRQSVAGRTPHQVHKSRPERQSDAPDGISPVQQRILDALAELEALGSATPARELVALLAGYTHLQSKGFVNAVSVLSASGAIAYPSSGTMKLTPEGRAAAVAPETPRTPEDVQQRVCQLLGGKSAEILRPLIDAYPNPVQRADVAAAAGYGHLQSKGFVNAVSKLSSLGFIRYPDRGTIAAAPVLFLEA
jgi:hypothetical protein